jgi:hypothetical protein
MKPILILLAFCISCGRSPTAPVEVKSTCRITTDTIKLNDGSGVLVILKSFKGC